MWLDLLGLLSPADESEHYMGYLVLQSGDDKSFDVIDGQQRLTTISIIVWAILKNIQWLIDAGGRRRVRTQGVRALAAKGLRVV